MLAPASISSETTSVLPFLIAVISAESLSCVKTDMKGLITMCEVMCLTLSLPFTSTPAVISEVTISTYPLSEADLSSSYA